MQQDETIILNDDLLIGRGGHRDVYINPLNPAQCIKLNIRAVSDHIREMEYRKSRERRHLPPSTLLTGYYGEVGTNLGTGYVFERIFDYDGTTSKTIDDIIKAEQRARDEKKSVKEIMDTEKEIPPAIEILLHFRKELFKENIIIPDMAAYNYMVQFDTPEKWRIRIVDDLGTAARIPLVYYIDYLGAGHVRRRWIKFVQWIVRKHPRFLTEEEKERLLDF